MKQIIYNKKIICEKGDHDDDDDDDSSHTVNFSLTLDA